MKGILDGIGGLERAGFSALDTRLIRYDRPDATLERAASESARFRAYRDPVHKPKPLTVDAATARWQTGGRRIGPDFPIREVKALFSVPDILFDPTLARALDGRPDLLDKRSVLEALIHAYILHWNPKANRIALERCLIQAVMSWSGTTRLITLCKEQPKQFFSPASPEWLARRSIDQQRPVTAVLDDWGMTPAVGLGRAACLQVPGAFSKWVESQRGSWTGAALEPAAMYFVEKVACIPEVGHTGISQILSQLIVADFQSASPRVQGPLKAFVLSSSEFGDPRLSANDSKWASVSAEARRIVSLWLSKQTLEFFFKEVLPAGVDIHGRRQFWESYLPLIEDCLVVLCDTDFRRLAVRLDLRGEVAHMEGSSNTSAFIMRFRGANALLVVEFSRSGNAIRVHDNMRFESRVRGGIRPMNQRFHLNNDLKNPSTTIAKFSHAPPHGWQDVVRAELARRGIRGGRL